MFDALRRSVLQSEDAQPPQLDAACVHQVLSDHLNEPLDQPARYTRGEVIFLSQCIRHDLLRTTHTP
jgi:hypothetical protein